MQSKFALHADNDIVSPVPPPAVKKKFKLPGHRRTGSSDSKVSQGPFSLLGRSKQSNTDLNNLCINGSHVYAEEAESKSGSTVSLNSSGRGSVEDVRKHPDADTSKTAPSLQMGSERATVEQRRHQEEQERKQAEERRAAEAKRMEEEEKHGAEAKRLQEEEERRRQEEQERKKRFLEDEARKRRQREEEEERRKREEEAAEKQRLEEERGRAEEQKRQEEASMSDRLTSLFGMIRKKEEKKEEPQQRAEEETPAHTNHHSTNPFEDVPLTSESPASSSNQKKSSHNPQIPSATVFLNRTAKVSAVKPR